MHINQEILAIKISGEKIRLKNKFDLITAASCFHWLDDKKISKTINFHLKDKGYFLLLIILEI